MCLNCIKTKLNGRNTVCSKKIFCVVYFQQIFITIPLFSHHSLLVRKASSPCSGLRIRGAHALVLVHHLVQVPHLLRREVKLGAPKETGIPVWGQLVASSRRRTVHVRVVAVPCGRHFPVGRRRRDSGPGGPCGVGLQGQLVLEVQDL